MPKVNKVRSGLYKSARVLGDVEAVRKNRVGKRIVRRATGKVAGKVLREITR